MRVIGRDVALAASASAGAGAAGAGAGAAAAPASAAPKSKRKADVVPFFGPQREAVVLGPVVRRRSTATDVSAPWARLTSQQHGEQQQSRPCSRA